ncbi:MAG: aspartate-semialdehyde dehydrogenase [Planctomycetes bacterium]|nr:aspartate-semialdehyde dehydrogenase [Planctomycetota bacterium]
MPRTFTVAVVGATGAVGQEMIRVLEQRRFPVGEIRLLASPRSAGRKARFAGREIAVSALGPDSFRGVEIALFSAGSSISKEFCPLAAAAGAVCVDNTSAFRMDPAVPLVVPEVNPHRIREHQGIIANPNCSTIQMVVALKPIHDLAGIKRIVVTTFQAVSGAGARAMAELESETSAVLGRKTFLRDIFPHQIAFNAIPQIPQKDAFDGQGNTVEELKMVNETRKILEAPGIGVSATCVRVPVLRAHSESVNVETERKLTAAAAREALRSAQGVAVVDDPDHQLYPLATLAACKDAVYVGRIREDHSVPNGLCLWVVADNLLKGAALNAVQIAEHLI